ncbi:MAG: PQQ-binding-like beta-propeller repeat protein [Planctomycetes bacterium]|nr:PQQ-binding-like beta-propeller repeat protein [Planctomycetota bacterium]
MERARIEVRPARLIPLGGGSREVVLAGDGRLAAFRSSDLHPLWSAPLPPDGAAVRAGSSVVHADDAEAVRELLVRDASTGAITRRVTLPSPLSTCEEASESPLTMRLAARARALAGATSQRPGLPHPWRGDTILAAEGACLIACCGASLLWIDLLRGEVEGQVERPPGTEVYRVWGEPRLALAYGFDAPMTLLDLERQARWSHPELVPLHATEELVVASQTDSSGRDLVGVALRTGRVERRWRVREGGVPRARCTERGLVVATNGSRGLAAVDPNGEVAWSVDVCGFVTDLAVVGDVVHVAVGPIELTADRVLALDATTGQPLGSWTAEPASEPWEVRLVPVEDGVVAVLWSDPAGTRLVRLG